MGFLDFVEDKVTNPISTVKTAATGKWSPIGGIYTPQGLAARGIKKGYNATVGEWGDRDFSAPSGQSLSQAAGLQDTQQQTLFGQPAADIQPSGPGPLGQQLIANQQATQAPPSRFQQYVSGPSEGLGAHLIQSQWRPDAGIVERTTNEYELGQYMRDQQGEEMRTEMGDRLVGDWETLLSEDTDWDEIEDWKTLSQSIVEVIENAKDPETGTIADQEMWEGGQALLNRHYETLLPHLEVVAPGWAEENFVFDEGYSLVGKTARGLAAPIINQLQNFAINQMQGLKTIKDAVAGNLDEYEFAPSWTPAEGETASFRKEILGKDEDWGGQWGTLLDLSAEIAIDPLTYLSGGTPAIIKSAKMGTAVHAKKAGQAALKRHGSYWAVIEREGFGALDEIAQLEMQKWVRLDAVQTAARQGSSLTGKARKKLSDAILGEHKKIKSLDDKINKITEKNMKAIEKKGQEGLKAAGHTIVPTHKIPVINRFKDQAVFGDEATELIDVGRKGDVERPFASGVDYKTTVKATDTVQPNRLTAKASARWGQQFQKTADEVAGLVADGDPRVRSIKNKGQRRWAQQFLHEADKIGDVRHTLPGSQTYQGIDYIDELIRTGDDTVLKEVIPMLDEVVYQQLVKINPGWGRKMAGSIPGLRRRFIPRADLIGSIGKAHSNAVRAHIDEAVGMANDLSRQAEDRLGGVIAKKVAKQLGMDEEQLLRTLNAALADPDEMMKLEAAGGDAAKLVSAFNDIREQVWKTLEDNLDPETLALFGSKDKYIPRVITEKGRKWLANLSDEDLAKLDTIDASGIVGLAKAEKVHQAAEIRQKSMKDAFTEARTIRPEIQDIFELNDELREMFEKAGVTDPEDLFETNVMVAQAARSQSAFRAKMMNEMVEGMTDLTSEAGEALAVHADDWANWKGNKLKMTAPEGHTLGDFHIHQDLVPHLNEINQVLLDPNRLDGFGKMADYMQSTWARYATLSPGFHSRNALGNVFLAFLGGVTNPGRFAQAGRLQRKHARIRNHMRTNASSWDEAAKAIKLTDAENTILKDMQRYRISAGTVGDVFKDTNLQPFSPKELVNPFNQSSINPTMMSRRLGTMIEHNARMALYIDAIEKGMTPSAAAAHVKEFLFDYDDLTKFEQSVRRHVSRFYTFVRKNTALQARMLATNPGRTHNALRIVEASENILFGKPDEEGELVELPAWAEVTGMRLRGGNAVGFETPFHAAANTVEDIMAPITAFAEMAGAPVDKLPDSVQDALFYHNVQERIGQALGLFSGLNKSVADMFYSQATGYDPFTGALVGYDNPRTKDVPGFWDLVGVANPMVDRLARWGDDVKKVADGSQDLELTLWNILGGAMVYEDERLQRSAANTMQRNMDELLRQMGDDKLTLDELREESRVATVNRFMHIMTYGGLKLKEGELMEEEIFRQLAGIVPKEILEYYANRNAISSQLVEDREYSSERRPQGDMERALAALPEVKAALEQMLGRPLDQQEEVNLILTSPLAPYMSDLEAYGLEGFRDYADPTRNIFTKDDYVEEKDDRVRETLNQLGSVFSLDFDSMLSLRPRLTETQRAIEQARLAGVSEDEVFQYLAEESSRLDINVMFGKDALSKFTWMGFDEKDAAREQNAWVEDRAKFIFMYEYVTGRPPTQDEINRALAHMNIGRTDQKYLIAGGYLGDLGPYPPSRENLQSDQEQANDALLEYQAGMAGAEGNRFMGLYPEPDQRKSIELGGADWLYGSNRFEEAPDWTQTN